MPCYSPLKGYFSAEVNPTGKRNIIFDPRKAIDDRGVDLPCGQCIGCRLERSRQWAMRCVHEKQLYEKNCFLTLTYSPEHLPANGSLKLIHFQRFMKRLRKHAAPQKLRFFHCGEYGEKYQRPHYHAIIFNYDFNDKELFRVENDNNLYTSPSLQKIWPLGRCIIGDVTFESAAYVARYITKKITGPQALHHYNLITPTGEILAERTPEYTTMSRRPGIGRPWLDKYLSDVYPDDFVLMRGKKLSVPKFYDQQLQKHDPYLHDEIKERREKNGKKQLHNNTYERLAVREFIHLRKSQKLSRKYENEP